MGEVPELVRTVEVNADVVGAVASAAVFYLVLRVLPGISFPLHRWALRLFLMAVALSFVVETAAAAEGLLGFRALGIVVATVAHDFSQVLLVLCLGLSAYFLYRSERDEISLLRQSADVDALTALHNRSFFLRAAARRMDFARGSNFALSCVVMDIDDFKPYNDAFGHRAGDAALGSVARSLRESARADDLTARYGGEEFILLTTGSAREAAVAAERLRSRIEARCTPEHDAALRRPITVSVGVAPLTAGTASLEDLIEAADEAMYSAKRAGKNRISVTGEGSGGPEPADGSFDPTRQNPEAPS